MKKLPVNSLSLLCLALAACGPDTGSAENPVPLPDAEITKLLNNGHWPMMSERLISPLYILKVDNQSSWHLTSLLIGLQKTHDHTGQAPRQFQATPIQINLATGKIETVDSLPPYTAGTMICRIGKYLAHHKTSAGKHQFEEHDYKPLDAYGFKD